MSHFELRFSELNDMKANVNAKYEKKRLTSFIPMNKIGRMNYPICDGSRELIV